jgi:TadE-like protein
MRKMKAIANTRQCGTTTIEFALVAMIFFTLIMGVIDFGRWIFASQSAAEATRLGARTAVVCDVELGAGGPARSRMLFFLPGATNANILISYSPAGCTITSCVSATVSLTGYTIPAIAWFLPNNLAVPNFATTLTRESLQSIAAGSTSASCTP